MMIKHYSEDFDKKDTTKRIIEIKQCNSIVSKNGIVFIDGKPLSEIHSDCTEKYSSIQIIVDGNVNTIDISGSVMVNGDVSGDIDCGGSCAIGGVVMGDIDCGGSCTCYEVSGSIDAGGSVTVNNKRRKK